MFKHTSEDYDTTLHLFIGKIYALVTCPFVVSIYVVVLAMKCLQISPNLYKNISKKYVQLLEMPKVSYLDNNQMPLEG